MKSKEVIAVASRSFSKNNFLVDVLKERYPNTIFNLSGKTLYDEELIEFLFPADKAIIGLEEINIKTLDQLPRLKVVSKYGVGLNNLDLQAFVAKGIRLGFTPGVNKQSVAELAFTLLMISLRKIHQNHHEIITGEWPQEKGQELHGKTIGLLGFGHIGQKLASLIQPFRCKIQFFDAKDFTSKELEVICKSLSLDPGLLSQVPLSTILSSSDAISVHLPLLPSTENIISAFELSQMKSSVRIINTARGGIVNEVDLMDFLSGQPEAFAAFDVYLEEPVKNNPLFSLQNFFGTSHRSSLTIEGINSMGLAAIKGLDDNIIPN